MVTGLSACFLLKLLMTVEFLIELRNLKQNRFHTCHSYDRHLLTLTLLNF